MKKNTYFIIIFLMVISCIAFGRIEGNDFINYDDNKYITENDNIQSGFNSKNIKWAFTAIVVGNWHPLTLLSHMLDWKLFEANASGHHLVSLILHIGTVIFLFLFLYKTTNDIWPSAFSAAFFALHPLRVESVAWAAERKDVLSMFFGMACLYAYVFYAEKTKILQYMLCLILFALALMSKPMLVTLPFLLMLLDYWPLGRWQRALSASSNCKFKLSCNLILEKVPFILLTIFSSIITFWAQKKDGAINMLGVLPPQERASNAIISYIDYLGKIFLPMNLTVFYPYELSIPIWKVVIFAIIVTLITLTVVYYFKKLPFLFTGWFWYLGTLVPVIGLVQVGKQAMADRYTYLPSIGIAIMLAWGIPLLFSRRDIRKKILFPTAIIIIFVMAVLTWMQCGYWKNSIEIWSHTLRVTNNNVLAYSRLGNAYGKLKKYHKAIDNFNEIIRIQPDYVIAYNGRGISYNAIGQAKRAIDDFNKAISLKPDYADAWSNRAFTYLNQGDNILGCSDAKKACELGNCKIWDSRVGKRLCH